MIVVDDHLAFLAIAGRLPDLAAEGPIVTTWSFHFRMSRAVAESARSGALSRRLEEVNLVSRRVVHPPANRLIVLDSRQSVDQIVRIAADHGANLLLAELVGASAFHHAAVRVTKANVGRSWRRVMEVEQLDFAAVDI